MQDFRQPLSASSSSDRYGFPSITPCLMPTALPLEKKPSFRINVSSTGESSIQALSQETREGRCKVGDTSKESLVADINRLFKSPYLRGHSAIQENLIAIVNDSNYLRSNPYFRDCSPHPDSVMTFNSYILHLRVIITNENKRKESREIIIPSITPRNLPSKVMLRITSMEDEYLGSAKGIIASEGKSSFIRLENIYDFASNEIEMVELPDNSIFGVVINLKEGAVTQMSPGTDKEEKSSTSVSEKPYFDGFEPTECNYFEVIGEKVEFFLSLPDEIVPFFLPLTRKEKSSIKVSVVDANNDIIATTIVNVSPDGRAETTTLVDKKKKKIEWDSLPSAKAIHYRGRI